MKTTVKLSPGQRLSVEPMKGAGGIHFELTMQSDTAPRLDAFFCLTPDQAGALIFGMEQALEAMDVKRAGVTA